MLTFQLHTLIFNLPKSTQSTNLLKGKASLSLIYKYINEKHQVLYIITSQYTYGIVNLSKITINQNDNPS